jgi:hypothetical protein
MKNTLELHKRWKDDPSKGEVFTPVELVNEMLDKIPTSVWVNPTSTFLDPCMGKGTFLVEIVNRLVYIYGYSQEDAISRVYGYDIRIKYVNYLKRGGFKNVFHKDFLSEEFNMKFDVVIGNPPYQVKVGETNTEPIWDKFVLKTFEVVKEGGYVSLIHPSGWRSPKGRFKRIQNLLRSKKIHYLNLNDFNEGQKTFGVGTNFDFYCVQNINDDTEITEVVSIDNEVFNIDLNKFNFIPNGMFELFGELIADDNEVKVNMIHSESFYAHRKQWMSKEMSDEFQYPCVYSITKGNGLKFYYSRVNNKGHFGLPKVIWSNGLGTYPVIDSEGDYGLMEYSFGINDSIENLENIKIALESTKMLKLMTYVRFTNNKYDNKVIATFKKDFWKHFIDE